MAASTLTQLLLLIADGAADGNERVVYDALKQRRDQLGMAKRSTLTREAKVVFNDNARPDYLIGLVGTVKGFLQKRVSIQIDEYHPDGYPQYAGRFGTARPIRTPIDMVDPYEPPKKAATGGTSKRRTAKRGTTKRGGQSRGTR